MKVLLQDAVSQKYLALDWNWTADLHAARDFHSGPDAAAMARQDCTHDLRVILYFEELEYTIAARRSQPGHFRPPIATAQA
jgi:hypothetical protein